MIDPYPLRSGALLSGTALCRIKPATPKRQIIVKGPVASIRIQKQPSQPYPVAKPEGARWVMTINPQPPTPDEPTAQTKPLIDDPPKDNAPNERQTKITKLIAMLRREGGATIDEMAEATAWKVHSVRGALSGILKKAQPRGYFRQGRGPRAGVLLDLRINSKEFPSHVLHITGAGLQRVQARQ